MCSDQALNLYGVYPLRHGVLKNDMRMNEEYTTIKAMMNKEGYIW
jgi:hypothetical protein